MPIPEFIASIREKIGTDLLWLPGTFAVVLRSHPDTGTEQVLLVRRADSGAWTAVTGILDPGEEPAAGAVREVLEETCVVARVERLVWVHVIPTVEYANGDRSAYLSLCFRCSWVSGEPEVGDDESSEVGWFDLDSLPEMSREQRRGIELAVADAPEAVFSR